MTHTTSTARVLEDVAVLGAFAAGFAALGVWRLRWERIRLE
jgi:hypothetical protein